MNKQQFKTLVETWQKENKLSLREGEFEKLWQEEEAKAVNVASEKKDMYIVGQLFAEFNQRARSKAEEFFGVVLGVSDVTDFGASKIFNTMKASWEKANDETKKVLLTSRQYDAEGNPLWHNANTKNERRWKNEDGTWKASEQRKINPEKEKQKHVLLIAKKKEDKEMKVTKLTLYNDKIDLQVPVGKQVEFRATGKPDQDGNYRLNSAVVTEFNVVSQETIPHHELLKVVNDYFAKQKVDFNEIRPSIGFSKLNEQPVVVITNATATRVTMTGDGVKNNVVNINSLLGALDAKEEVTCWIHKGQKINVSEGDSELVLFVQPMWKSENLSVNVLGLFNPKTAVDIKPVETEQEVW